MSPKEPLPLTSCVPGNIHVLITQTYLFLGRGHTLKIHIFYDGKIQSNITYILDLKIIASA